MPHSHWPVTWHHGILPDSCTMRDQPKGAMSCLSWPHPQSFVILWGHSPPRQVKHQDYTKYFTDMSCLLVKSSGLRPLKMLPRIEGWFNNAMCFLLAPGLLHLLHAQEGWRMGFIRICSMLGTAVFAQSSKAKSTVYYSVLIFSEWCIGLSYVAQSWSHAGKCSLLATKAHTELCHTCISWEGKSGDNRVQCKGEYEESTSYACIETSMRPCSV
jgi:hypothetical protein